MERNQVKKKVEEIQKKIDSMDNNNFTKFKFQSLNQNPQIFQNFRRDKGKDIDAGKALLGRNKRRRRRDVSEHPRNC